MNKISFIKEIRTHGSLKVSRLSVKMVQCSVIDFSSYFGARVGGTSLIQVKKKVFYYVQT